MKFDSENLKNFVSAVLQKANLSKENAATVSESLVSANLRGVDSHGVTRLPIYIERLQKGVVNPNPEIEISNESASSLLVDGKDGMGQIVGSEAIKLGIEKAKKNGGAFVGVKNSTHFGTGAYFIQQAIEENLIAFAMSNAPSTMAPWGGVEPYFGTNPYAFGVPAGERQPIIFDMATSVVARGKIITAEQKGEEIPEGWAIDKDGRPTTNASEALQGSVLPFAGPKGYAVSLMIDVMSGVLTGAEFGSHINNIYGDFDKPQKVGHFFQLIDVNQFMELKHFQKRIDQMIEEIKAAPKGEGIEEIYLPGEIEANTERKRLTEGIYLTKEVYNSLKQVGKESGVPIENYQD